MKRSLGTWAWVGAAIVAGGLVIGGSTWADEADAGRSTIRVVQVVEAVDETAEPNAIPDGGNASAINGSAAAPGAPIVGEGSVVVDGGITEGEYIGEGVVHGGPSGPTGFGGVAAGGNHFEYGRPDLFYNFYVPNPYGAPTQLYLAPRPVPAMVGHVYYTYQPLMPHEFLYPHTRTYRKYYDDGRGITRTRVHWYHSPLSFLHSTTFKIAR